MKKITLRAVEPEDIDLMYASDNDEEARIWTDYSAPISRNQLLQYALSYDADPFSTGQLRLIVETAVEEDLAKPVGIVDLYDISQKDGRGFIGIYILPKFRHKGFALAAVNAATRYCFSNLGLRILSAKVSTRNHYAVSLFRKAGFSQLCILPEWHRLGGDYHDIALFYCSKTNLT